MNPAIIITLVGGLGMFLYGMKLMSDGLEKAAGARLRGILEFFTKNRFVGMLVGILFTAIVQSSSATTVLVVSFVNSGLMSLLQAAGVIMGANIGTTVTSQLIAFNLSDIAPLFIMGGVIMVMFCKNQNIKKVGEVVLGFGILFMGLATMSSALSTLKESPEIVNVIASLKNHILAVLVGFVITAVLQSSSATVGIVLLMAQQGLLELPICFYIMLGCNMGSCVSALIASLGGKKDAKRAAMIHFLFNIIGSAAIIFILLFGLDAFSNFIYKFSGQDIGRSVANAHTVFKIFQVILLFPFAKLLVKMTYLIVPGDDKEQTGKEFTLQYIGEKAIFSPATAVVEATNELRRMGNMALENLELAMDAFVNQDVKKAEEVYHVEKNINYMNHSITDYLVKINQMTLPLDDSKNIGGLFHVVNDIERIGDHAENIADAAKTRLEDGVVFSKSGIADLKEMLEKVTIITNYALDMFSYNSKEHLEEILQLEDEIDNMERELQHKHVVRLTKNECSPEAGMLFSDMISGLERVADHATNIAFSILEPEADED